VTHPSPQSSGWYNPPVKERRYQTAELELISAITSSTFITWASETHDLWYASKYQGINIWHHLPALTDSTSRTPPLKSFGSVRYVYDHFVFLEEIDTFEH